MKLALSCTVALSLLVAGCQTSGSPPSVAVAWDPLSEIQSGPTRLSFRNIDLEKWDPRIRDSDRARKVEFLCRPLACAAPTVASIQVLTSPTRKPDRTALLDMARRFLAEKTPDLIVTSDAKLSVYKGFPSVAFAGYIEGKERHYGAGTFVYAGSLSFLLLTRSKAEAPAHAGHQELLDAIVIRDGGGPVN